MNTQTSALPKRASKLPGESQYQVIIAGGGPAGCACAAAILRRRPDLAGHVLILDKAEHPRDKPCGGGLTGHVPSALAALGLQLNVPALPSPYAQVHYGSIKRRVPLTQPVQVIRREEFDASLLSQVAALGATVHQGQGLERFAVTADGVTLHAGGRSLRAEVLIGADGAGSALRKHIVGHRENHGPRPLRLFRAELPIASPYGDEMIYDFSPMAAGLRGYLWIFPVPGGRTNVGIMHFQGQKTPALSGAELSTLCARELARHGIEVPPATLRGWPAWGYEPSRPLSAPRLLLCGDAAGIDALTGEGIAVALEQGLCVGEAVCEGLARSDLRFAAFQQSVEKANVGRELALDRTLARLFYDHAKESTGWQRWLSMVLFDERLLSLYAARVSGTLVLSDQKRHLVPVLLRHLLSFGQRARRLQTAI